MIKVITPKNDFEKKVTDNNIYNEETEENLNEIKNILDNDDSINNLLTNPTSKHRNSITKENIKNLIRLCLYPNSYLNNKSSKELRYPYYSCQLLCSSLILCFSLSIKNIKANSIRKNGDKMKDSEEK